MSEPEAGNNDGRLWKGVLPVHGVLEAGPLKGWRYAFLQFTVIGTDLAMDMRCSCPGWPFPKDVRFFFRRDLIRVRAVPGERAKRLDANALIEQAIQNGVAKAPYEFRYLSR